MKIMNRDRVLTQKSSLWRNLPSSIPLLLGNFLEILEFALFGIFSGIFSRVFFQDIKQGMIYSLAIFAAGFLARPIGGIIFGHIGDRYGRRLALVLSISAMSSATLSIGFLPDPAYIGLAAPFLLLFFRIIQGISCGGEYTGISIFMYENYPQTRGTACAFSSSSGMCGVLLGITLSILTQHYTSFEWSWRLPFLISGSLSLVILYLRRMYLDSESFTKVVQEAPSYPFIEVLKRYILPVISVFCVGACNGVLYIALIIYFNVYLTQYNNLTLVQALGVNFMAVLSSLFGSFSIGYLKDRFNLPIYGLVSVLATVMLLISPHIFSLLLSKSMNEIILGEIITGLLAGSFSVCCTIFMCQVFPREIRYSGVSLGYTLGTSIVGGTTPVICQLLIEYYDNVTLPSVYFQLAAGLALLGCGLSYLSTTSNIFSLTFPTLKK